MAAQTRSWRYYWRGFWMLGKGFWFDKQSKKSWFVLAVVLVMNVASVGLTVVLNDWYKEFWDVLQSYQFGRFWPLVGEFTLLATLLIALGIYSVYLRQWIQIEWRQYMTDTYLNRWLDKKSYYMLKVLGYDTDNPDQRIQEDINSFANLTLTLTLGMVSQVISLVAFVVILWNLSGIVHIPIGAEGIPIYGYMVWLSLLYSIGGTYLTHKVGRKLIGLNYEQQRREADFRFSMVRLRENSESIAFYRGEGPEMTGFKERFVEAVRNFRAIMKRQKLLNGFTTGYEQLAIIIPILLISPRWFAQEVQVGWIMQVLNAFGRVQNAMSYFVSVYDNLAQWCAVVSRLYDFEEHMQAQGEVSSDVVYEPSDTAGVKDLTVKLPDGSVLTDNLSFTMADCHSLLITGKSGTGKSTLLRTMAGLWPYATGTVLAADSTLFLPQRPYLPLGTLRRAIYFPKAEAHDNDEQLKAWLTRCGLGKLVNSLDEEGDWSRILSLGEQQRIAFLRILLYKPKFVFLDEATSAMDEALEKTMYEWLKDELPDTKVISVGHRHTLYELHDKKMALQA